MKILIIRFSSIGDIVLTSPVIRALKKQTNSELHFLSKKSFEAVTRNNPYLDKKYYFENNTSEILELLRAEKYNYVIDLQKNARSAKLKSLLGVKSYTFDKLNIRKWLTVNFKMKVLPAVHIVDRYMKAVEPLNVFNDGGGLDYFITAEDEKIISLLPASHKNYVGWVIGAKHYTKRLPLEKMISIAGKLKSPVVLLGGMEDFETAEKIVASTGSQFFNACGKFSLNESAALVRYAQKIITHDTGLMHIAAAFKKEIISIWGNTIPEFGMYPYYGDKKVNSKILEVKGLSCRPCSKIGFEKCPRGHFKCMREIDETIFEKLMLKFEKLES
jgi:ADP-heptose:LPS heptosyltransferase